MIGAGMKISIGVLLHEHPSGGGGGSVHHDEEQFGGIWHFDHWGGKEGFFEFYKHIILLFFPLEGYSLFC